jgi:hypothetical protein
MHAVRKNSCRRLPAACRVVRVAAREDEAAAHVSPRVALLLLVVSTTPECSARHEMGLRARARQLVQRPLVLFRRARSRSSSRPPPLGRRGFGLSEALVGVVPRQLPGAARTASGPRRLARRGRLERHAAEMSLVEMNLVVAELLVTPCSPRPGIRPPAARSEELSSPVLDLSGLLRRAFLSFTTRTPQRACTSLLHHRLSQPTRSLT